MLCGRLSNVIQTTKILQSFNKDDVESFKQVLFSHLGVVDEVSFLRRVLLSLEPKLSNESIDTLNSKAQELSSHHPIVKENDCMSKLNSDVIEHLGKFLTKQESLSFGRINRCLYVETHKKSFILNRRESNYTDESRSDALFFNQDNLIEIFDGKRDSIMYNYPTKLGLEYIDDINTITTCLENDKNKALFNSVFYSLNKIEIYFQCFGLLPFIPVDYLFNSRFTNNDQKVNIAIDYTNGGSNVEEDMERLSQFGENYKNYLESNCNKDNKNIRKINELSIICIDDNQTIQLLFNALNKNFQMLNINNCNFKMKTMTEFDNIFHCELKSLEMRLPDSDLFSNLLMKRVRDNNSNDDTNNTSEYDLQTLTIDRNPNILAIMSGLYNKNVLNNLTRLNLILENISDKNSNLFLKALNNKNINTNTNTKNNKNKNNNNKNNNDNDGLNWLGQLIDSNCHHIECPKKFKYLYWKYVISIYDNDDGLNELKQFDDQISVLSHISPNAGFEIEIEIKFWVVLYKTRRKNNNNNADNDIVETEYDITDNNIVLIMNKNANQGKKQIISIVNWLKKYMQSLYGTASKTFFVRYQ